MRVLKIIPALSVSVLALTGCNISAMPTLFHYHKEEYRSPPGPQAPEVGYEYSVERNARTAAAWHGMVSSVVNKLEASGDLQPQAVYLVPHQQGSTFMNMYEHALRKTLNDRGYTLLPEYNPDATLFFFEASPVVEQKAASTGPASEELAQNKAGVHAKPVVFRMVVMRDFRTLAMTESAYEMPLYGYQGGTSTVYPPDILMRFTTPPQPEPAQPAAVQPSTQTGNNWNP